MLIRRERPTDHPTVDAVHRAAFGGDTEAGLLVALRDGPWWIPELSLVAEESGAVVGHVIATRGSLGTEPAIGVGPVGVDPAAQARGIGSALMHALLGAAEARGETLVALLGEPGFYCRFGFGPAAGLEITAPDPTWGPYFQARRLAGAPQPGAFRYAAPFDAL